MRYPLLAALVTVSAVMQGSWTEQLGYPVDLVLRVLMAHDALANTSHATEYLQALSKHQPKTA